MSKISIYLLILLSLVLMDILFLKTGVLLIITGLLVISLIVTKIIFVSSESEQKERDYIIENGIQTEGVVTRVSTSIKSFRAIVFYKYRIDDTEIEGKIYLSLYQLKHKVGQPVMVLYLEENPEKNTIIINRKGE